MFSSFFVFFFCSSFAVRCRWCFFFFRLKIYCGQNVLEDGFRNRLMGIYINNALKESISSLLLSFPILFSLLLISLYLPASRYVWVRLYVSFSRSNSTNKQWSSDSRSSFYYSHFVFLFSSTSKYIANTNFIWRIKIDWMVVGCVMYMSHQFFTKQTIFRTSRKLSKQFYSKNWTWHLRWFFAYFRFDDMRYGI